MGVSIRECARQLGVSDTAIRKAIEAGRCAKLEDGTVDVEAIRAGMSSTVNPLRGGQRTAGEVGTLPVGPVVAGGAGAEPQGLPSAPPAGGGVNLQAELLRVRLERERLGQEREQIEMAERRGQVALVAPMVRAVHDAMVEARSSLLALPDRLTPLVTPETDAGKVYGLIETEVLRVIQSLHEKLQASAQLPVEEVSDEPS